MAGRHKGDTREFRELTFAEQASSIMAAINNLQAAIEHHVKHSPRGSETVAKCLAQIERLEQRLQVTCDLTGASSGTDRAGSGAEEVHRLRVGSPRLANPERAIDFTLDVAEEFPDAGLR